MSLKSEYVGTDIEVLVREKEREKRIKILLRILKNKPEVITDNVETAFPKAIRKMVMPPISLIMIPRRLIRAG